jgi:hypothetical protein
VADSAFQKMWSWAALAYVTLIATLFARTTAGGAPTELFGFISDITATTVPAVGLPVDLLTGLGMLALTYYWSRTRGQSTRAARIPCFHFLNAEVDPATPGGKAYRVLTFVVVHGFTLAATCQMLVRYFDQSVYRCGGKAVIGDGIDHFNFAVLSHAASEGMLCFGAPKAPETFAWLPWAYVLLIVFFFGMWAATAWRIFAKVRPSPHPPPPFPVLDL